MNVIVLSVCQAMDHANMVVCSRGSGGVSTKSCSVSTEPSSGTIRVNSGTSESIRASVQHILSTASEVAATLIFTNKSTQLNSSQGKQQVNE